MGKVDIVQIVGDKVESEVHHSNAIIKKIEEEKRSFTNSTIREFFPKHEELWGINRTNLIPEISIASQLMYGSPVTIGLYPETIADFERRYKIDYKAAVKLVKEGWLFPNLYVQNPEDWIGYPELQELVKISTANGIRANKFLENRFPGFENYKNSRTEESGIVLQQLKANNLSSFQHVCRLLSATEDSAARVLGNRWAYIDCFSPDSSEILFELLQGNDFDKALDYLGVVQNLTVSPISGALGGHLTWSSSAIHRLKNVLNSNLKYRSNLTLGIADWQFEDKQKNSKADSRINEFLLQQITGASPYENLELSGANKLSSVTKNEEFKKLKLELNSTMIRIAKKSHKEVEEIELQEWVSLVKEVQTQVSHFKNIGIFTSNGVGLALGILTSNWQFEIGIAAAGIIDSKTDLLANGLHKLFKGNHHRFGVSTSRLNDLVPGNT